MMKPSASGANNGFPITTIAIAMQKIAVAKKALLSAVEVSVFIDKRLIQRA